MSDARASHPQLQARDCARGSFLIEALIAVLVVSIASAGLFAMTANLVKASRDTTFRAEAAQIVAAALARMAAEDPATLASRYDADTGGPAYASLLAQARRLPGAGTVRVLPVVAIEPGPSQRTLRVAVTLRWQPPSAPMPRHLSMSAVVGP